MYPFNSFPVAAYKSVTALRASDHHVLSILSQLLLVAPRRGGGTGAGLSILSQLLRGKPWRPTRVTSGWWLSILSQLLQIDATLREIEERSGTFNSFPVAAGGTRGAWWRGRCTFNSFPVAAVEEEAEGGSVKGFLSILSQLLPLRNAVNGVQPPLSFNSFPVAAEALASCLLISLSFANFEVPESLPALPTGACSGSRKPFPDSRRKEGIWRERSGVERKR